MFKADVIMIYLFVVMRFSHIDIDTYQYLHLEMSPIDRVEYYIQSSNIMK